MEHFTQWLGNITSNEGHTVRVKDSQFTVEWPVFAAGGWLTAKSRAQGGHPKQGSRAGPSRHRMPSGAGNH